MSHGNTCRPPMAVFVLKDMARRAGLERELYIESAATSSEELGNPVYPPVRKLLALHGIDCSGKAARRMTYEDYARFDLIIYMDEENLWNMAGRVGDDPEDKCHMLMEYAGKPGQSVTDPWYSRDFDATWRDVNEGCLGLLNELFPETTLDLSRCEDRGDIYAVLRSRMLWQEDWGENLDALYDILTGERYLGKRFRFIMPEENAPEGVKQYAKRVRAAFEEAGIELRKR